MQLGRGTAPGKAILFGEHAVVYGRPALAVPVTQVSAEASVEPGADHGGVVITALDTGEQLALRDAPSDHPLARAARLALERLGLPTPPDWSVTVRSTIPIASGLGSGAAVSTAIARAMGVAGGKPFGAAEVSEIVYEVERLHHGTPSGVDNTVIAYGQPVYFVRGRPPAPFTVASPMLLAVGNSGIASPTRITVGDVRDGWRRDHDRYEALFERIGGIVEEARAALNTGDIPRLGPLMDENHSLLRELGVSCEALDRLVAAACDAGAGGAKLSGGGRGGNMIAAVTHETAARVAKALRAAGAVQVIITEVK